MTQTKITAAPAADFTTVYSRENGRQADAAIIVPMLNGKRFLQKCWDSIRSQQDVALEVVIVDDGSYDGSCDLACELLSHNDAPLARGIIIKHSKCAGPAAARDTGMRVSTAESVLFLDVDNEIYPRCVKRCLQGIETSGAAFVYPILRIVGDRSGLIGYLPFNRERLGRGNYIDMLAMVRRCAWQFVGGFPDLRDGMEDYAFWLTLIEHGYFGAQVPEILGEYRSHPSSRTAALIPLREKIHTRLKAAFPWITLN